MTFVSPPHIIPMVIIIYMNKSSKVTLYEDDEYLVQKSALFNEITYYEKVDWGFGEDATEISENDVPQRITQQVQKELV